MSLRVFSSISKPSSCHLLAYSPLFKKFLFVVLDEITQHHINLANQCDGNITNHFIGAIRQDTVIVFTVAMFTTTGSSIVVSLVTRFPQYQMMMSKIILVIFQQFLMAGFGDIK